MADANSSAFQSAAGVLAEAFVEDIEMKALIRIIRKTEYASVVEMSDNKFAQLKSDLDSKDRTIRRAAEKEANSLIDVEDWQDDDFDSVEEFTAFATDK